MNSALHLALATTIGCTAPVGVSGEIVLGPVVKSFSRNDSDTSDRNLGMATGPSQHMAGDDFLSTDEQLDAAIAILQNEGVMDAAAELNAAVSRKGNRYTCAAEAVAEVKRSIEAFLVSGPPNEEVAGPTGEISDGASVAREGAREPTKDQKISYLAVSVVEKIGRAYNIAPVSLRPMIRRGATALGSVKGIVNSALNDVAHIEGLAQKGEEYLILSGVALIRFRTLERIYAESRNVSAKNPTYNQAIGVRLIGSKALSTILGPDNDQGIGHVIEPLTREAR